MNIKQASELSGVSPQNIRFYEREKLLLPERNPENGYREYSSADIKTLKTIRVLRMLDMPLDIIREILQGRLPLEQAAQAQTQRLRAQAQELAAAIRICQELTEADTMDVDALLRRMEHPEVQEGLFIGWLRDYRKVALAEHEKQFTFTPDEAVTNPQEFTMALFEYANANQLDLVITRESMNPEFTINGIEYTAQRYYTPVQRIPVAVIRCEVKYPEDFEPEVPEKRRKFLKLVHYSWIPLIFILLTLLVLVTTTWGTLFGSWEGWLMIIAFAALAFTGLYRTYFFWYNYNGKRKE